MSNLERKFGKYAVPGLVRYLIFAYVFGIVIRFANASFLNYLTLNPYEILHGQIWRLVTWVIIPPLESNIFFFLITCVFYYQVGMMLERVWGTWRFNVYMFGGLLFTILGSFLLMGTCYLFFFEQIRLYTPRLFFSNVFGVVSSSGSLTGAFSSYYVNMSLFLAYATTFPDQQVLLMFILPIKVKWLGIVYGLMLLYSCIPSGYLITDMINWFVIGSSLLNFLIFFLTTRRRMGRSPKQAFRKMRFDRETRHAGNPYGGISKHKCAICGRTELSNPELFFRFCSKCAGNYEYCQDHLFTHRHIQ